MKTLLALTALFGPGACTPRGLLVRGTPPLDEVPAGLALAPPVILAERLGHEPWEAFHQGTWVGSIWFSGGYERMPEEENQVRSVNVELADAASYTAQARREVAAIFETTLVERGWSYQALALPVDPAYQEPTRTERRGTEGYDGRDDQNLPSFSLDPQPLVVQALPALPQGTRTLLVPAVVHYYGHNGGWFVGQELGCSAGARARVLWSLHDVADGRVLAWGELGTRYEQEYFYSPNQAQLQDYLLRVEQALGPALSRQLGR